MNFKILKHYIDSHQHFWKYEPSVYRWIDDSMQVLKHDFLPEDLEPVLEENQFQACVAVQALTKESENDFLLKCARDHDFVKAVVGWVNLYDENVEERLEFYSDDKNFKGLRHFIQSEPSGFMGRKDFRHGISVLGKFELTFDLLLSQNQLGEAIKLVKEYPNQLFVLDHMAKPFFSEAVNPEWKKNIEELGKMENVYCKISGRVCETENFKWEKRDFDPYLNIVFEAFGSHRLMFGSDWPVCRLSCEYDKVLSIIEGYLKPFSKNEQQLVMGKNAADFYKIELS